MQPAGRWKIVVVDSRSLKILSSACRMYDILEENVSDWPETSALVPLDVDTMETMYALTVTLLETLSALSTSLGDPYVNFIQHGSHSSNYIFIYI